MSLTQQIKQQAHELGFCSVGVAKADALEKEQQLLQEWLKRGYHGKMHYMENHFAKRVDPRELFPGTKSVISLAMNYYTPHEHSHEEMAGKISRYAWGDDYHDVMKKRLWQLFDYMKKLQPEITGKVCVDTAPIMDKAWAVKSGIGWQGKHSNVISREHGSWIFLGEILVDIPLEYDQPIQDFCGSCTRCIDACPTKAIVEPYVIDASRCIPYLTIELKADNPIPQEHVPNMENWVFGCDICQDVCPWNQKFAHPTDESAFQPREGLVNPSLIELAELSEEEFRKKFRKSPVKRPKYKGFLRNVQAALKGAWQKLTKRAKPSS